MEFDVLPVGHAGWAAEDEDNFASGRGDGRSRDALGVFLGDGVEHVADGVASRGLDLADNFRVSVVEDRVGAERFNGLEVTRRSGGDYLVAGESEELDSELANGSCSVSPSSVCAPVDTVAQEQLTAATVNEDPLVTGGLGRRLD